MSNVSLTSSALRGCKWLIWRREWLSAHNARTLAWKRTFISNTRPEDSGQTHHKGLQHPEQPTELSDDGTYTLRSRKHGNRALPLPPFLDPLRIAALSQRTGPKTPTSEIKAEDLTDFQKELATNPYAQALATVVRLDIISTARVPAHFLLRFKLAYDAGTDRDGAAASATMPVAKSTNAQLAFVAARPSHKSVTSYVLANHTVMPDLRKRAAMLASASHRQQFARRTGLSAKKLTVRWHPELPDEVLAGLRKVFIDEINACVDSASPTADSPEDSLAAPATTALFVKYSKDDSLSVKALACLLCVEGGVAGSRLPHEVPKYSLPHLLGEGLAAEVAQTIGLGELCAIGVVKHARVTPLVLALERLQMYIS